jgi:plastocyanin
LARVRKLVLTLLALSGFAAGALPALGASDHPVTVKNDFAYDPATITIATGDKVVWNHAAGAYAHNVKFDDGYEMPSAPTATAWSRERTFATAGSYEYYCALHGGAPYYMRGTVVVQDPPATQTETTTTGTGTTPTGTTPTETTPTTTTPTSTTPTTTTPAPQAVATGLAIKRAVKAGRVRGSLRAGPAGAKLTVRVRLGGKIVGRASRTVAAPGVIAFAAKLNAAARRRLARRGRLKVAVRADVRAGDSTALQSRVITLR